ncbi:MAG: cupin domain-containing protein [Lutibacter sp.]
MFFDIHSIKAKELLPGFKGKFVHTKNNTIAFWEIQENAVLPEHQHIHEQTTYVVEGILELTIGKEKKVLKAGQLVVIPSNIIHCGKAQSFCKVIDTFSPVREDYKN